MLHVGPVGVYPLGLALGLSFLAAGVIGRPLAVRSGMHPTSWWRTVVATMVVSVVGARAVYVLAAWEYFADRLVAVWWPPIDGFSFYGGFFVGVVFLAWLARRRGDTFWSTADLYALPYATGLLVASLLWNTPLLVSGAPSWVSWVVDLGYVSGLYVVMWWLWSRRKGSARGQLFVGAVLGDAILRLIFGSLTDAAVNGLAAFDATDVARILIAGLSAFFYWALGGRIRRPETLAEPFRRPMARWVGWLAAYGFLLSLLIATRAARGA